MRCFEVLAKTTLAVEFAMANSTARVLGSVFECVFDGLGVGVLELGAGGKPAPERRYLEVMSLRERLEFLREVIGGMLAVECRGEREDKFGKRIFLDAFRDGFLQVLEASSFFGVFLEDRDGAAEDEVEPVVGATLLDGIHIHVFFDDHEFFARAIRGTAERAECGGGMLADEKALARGTNAHFLLKTFQERDKIVDIRTILHQKKINKPPRLPGSDAGKFAEELDKAIERIHQKASSAEVSLLN